jgi:hypothetical protein
MELTYSGIPSSVADAYRYGAPDANGQVPERKISNGDGVPCRHCLGNVAEGEPYIVLAYRPFPSLQPYAEVGPIFIHAEPCEPHIRGGFPARERNGDGRILRGYGTDDRIVYGTGMVVGNEEVEDKAKNILQRPDVAYVHMRSANNNCYTLRIDRA